MKIKQINSLVLNNPTFPVSKVEWREFYKVSLAIGESSLVTREETTWKLNALLKWAKSEGKKKKCLI